VDNDNPDIQTEHRTNGKRLTDEEHGLLKRRQVTEPTIGRVKSVHRIDRCYFKEFLDTALLWCFARRVTTSAGCCT